MRVTTATFQGDGWDLPVPLGLADPIEIWSVPAERPDGLVALLSRLDEVAASGDDELLAVGFLTYEAGVWLEGVESAFRPPERTPLAHVELYRVDPAAPRHEEVQVLGEKAKEEIVSSLSHERWFEAVEAIRDGIARGDVYQVNLTRRLSAPLSVAPNALAEALFKENPVPYAVTIRAPGFSVVSNSPELFLDVDVSKRRATSRPIKGTAARGETPEDDAARAAGLLASEKDRAEHLMIVDLVRHDLGKVSVPGGVEVTELFGLRSFRHVHHLESTVVSRLREGATLGDVLRATLPAGSITGAPKRASLGFIHRLEPVPRGPYTGAIGYVRGNGRAVFNVGIRTAVLSPGTVDYHAGGGIVWDSDPEAEWRETEDKSREFSAVLARRQ